MRLLQIHWWRVVYDEAQMFGNGYGAISTMAARITSCHRWCVTGTPIGPGGLDDVHGLLKVTLHCIALQAWM